MDPISGEYVGQTLIDFTAQSVIQSLTQEETPLVGGFHVLLTPERDQLQSDTIVAPGFDFGGYGGQKTAPIEEFIVPDGEPEEGAFNEILNAMRAGGTGKREFERFTETGETETVYFSYAPVSVKSLQPVNASDFGRGVVPRTSNIFLLALAERADGVSAAFDAIEDSLQRTSTISISVLCVLIMLAFVSVLYLSSRVTASIITPVAQLLLLGTMINRFEIHEELPWIAGGSSEVSQVHQTFERLYMVVRLANTAFFSGDLAKAYVNLSKALALFTKLENPKAIGITTNNLGNTMLTIYRTMKKTDAPTMCGLSKSQVIEKGIKYFNDTIESGEKALAKTNEEEGWSTNYLIFMQQLSNRYFNRAMFLLTVKADHASPEEAERQGLTDLATAKDMDREVVDNGDQHGFTGDSNAHFDLLMCRTNGIMRLMQMGYTDEWGVDELIEEAFEELKGALKRPGDVLFQELEPAAQMQRMDGALVAFYMLEEHKDTKKAAAVAIRMLTEDEYIFGDAGTEAVKALITYVADATAEELGGEDPSNVSAALFQCKRGITNAMSLARETMRYGRNDVVAKESLHMSGIGDFSMENF